MVLHDPQEFGGLEEYAATLAVSLKQQGQDVSVLSTTWVSRNNQYIRRLLDNHVGYVQVPKWLSWPASHWPTKEKMLKAVLSILSPLIFLLAVGLFIFKYRNWSRAWKSAHGWLRGQLLVRLIGPMRYKPLTLLLLNWWRLRWRPDILHIQGYTTNLLFVIDWAYKKKMLIVYEEHQTPDAHFDWWQGFHHSINKATTVVAVSEKSAQALRDVCKVTRPIFVRSPLLPDPVKIGWRPKFDETKTVDQVVQITTVARLAVAKGLSYLLEAIAQVKAVYPFIQLRVYGDGPLRTELLAYARLLGLNGDEIFVGSFTNRDELSSIMAQTDIFVLSSVLEGQPLGVVEAMAYSCPIVTTSVGGIPELIQDGVNGLLCPPKDPECLTQKIITLIKEPKTRIKLGRAARYSYEQGTFQPISVCNEFIALYEKILQGQMA